MNDVIKNKLKQLPDSSGVYIMHDSTGNIIYVGKAKVLKNRVRQYFVGSHQAKVAAMVSQIADFEYIICDNEIEALVLECNLIKKYRPYYNILLKDDKHYPYVKIDYSVDFPVVEIVRSVKNDGARYFGPYASAFVIRDFLKSLYEVYPLRNCRKNIKKALEKGERPCQYFQMGKCCSPCTGRISEEEYLEMVREVEKMLGSGQQKLKSSLKKKMEEASAEMNYEQAAVLRDRIRLIEKIQDKQKAGMPKIADKDVFGVACGSDRSVVQAFFVRDGNLIHAEKHRLSSSDSESEVLENFLVQYYSDEINIPKTIYISRDIENRAIIEEWLSEKRGSHVSVVCPQRGENRKLVLLADRNAGDAIRLKENEAKRRTKGLEELQTALGTSNFPHRVECYDISNTQGTDSVASMVVMIDGEPKKKEYRKFRIKTVEGANDFASMAEVLTRRLNRALSASEGFEALPDLIIVDGGKGQLSAAFEILRSMGLDESIDICGLAKREEELFLPGKSDPVVLGRRSMALRLVTNLRDEAHRFAITYHRGLREKRQSRSRLDAVPGVGPARKKALLKAFGSLSGVEKASLAELKAVNGIPDDTAEAIYIAFHTE